ncbi:condensation domain-containing protein [Kitasatospora sp. NPDC059327]|uniref:condensation domain-containing protein n=1 Tax=Kitasatospora sp. NPDC059327 TaxID=3346803 RepID=UPI0036CFD1E1
MTESIRRIIVRYSGASSGFGPLTLGQDNMIRCIRRDRPEQINKESVWPVPDGVTVPAALDALRRLVERHDSLRTVFPAGPGPESFPKRQLVCGEGEFTVTVRAPAGRSTEGSEGSESVEGLEGSEGVDAFEGFAESGIDALADEVGRADVAVPFDLAAGPRLRFTLLVEADRVLRLIVVVCHAGADGAATTLLIRDWLALAAGKELPPVTARTPLEVAAVEQSDQGRRKAAAALRHWRKVLSAAPQAVFADSRITGPPDGVAAVVLRSRTAAADLAATSRRTGASPSVVLLAVFAALVARRADRTDLVMSALSANRQRAVMADHIGTLAQDALLALDTDTDDLDELIGRAKAASLAGYWHSTLPAGEVWALIEDIAHLRGSRFPRQVVVNDLSLTIPEAMSEARPAPTSDPELTWLPDQPVAVRVMLNILRISGSLEFALVACPQVLDREETGRFALAVPAVLEAAARGPVPLADLPALTGLGGAVRAGAWQRIEGSWVDLDAVRALVADALGSATRVEFADGRLVARIASAEPELTPSLAHRRVIGALPGRDTAMAPQHYVVHAAADPALPPHWGELAVVAEGSGRCPEVAGRLAPLG